jgi:hypothetical protein
MIIKQNQFFFKGNCLHAQFGFASHFALISNIMLIDYKQSNK